MTEVVLVLDGDAHAAPDLGLALVFEIRDQEWIQPDHLPSLGCWHGRARLIRGTVTPFDVPVPLEKIVAHLGPQWVQSLQRDAVEDWSKDQPSPQRERLERREDERKHDDR